MVASASEDGEAGAGGGGKAVAHGNGDGDGGKERRFVTCDALHLPFPLALLEEDDARRGGSIFNSFSNPWNFCSLVWLVWF